MPEICVEMSLIDSLRLAIGTLRNPSGGRLDGLSAAIHTAAADVLECHLSGLIKDGAFQELLEGWTAIESAKPTTADADSKGDVLFLRAGMPMLGRVTSGIPVDVTHWRHTNRST
jgi:hypothetical protein